jgi:microcystin degradation protein MlrC
MRIAVGQLWQETNTFNPNLTTWSDFEAMGVALGDDVITRFADTGELSGFFGEWNSSFKEATEFIGLARFACWPSGSVDQETWQRIRREFTDRLRAAGKVDGVFLVLHGALCAEGEPDVTGRLLADVRDIVGPDVVVVGSLDLHANFTRLMQEKADVLNGYHAVPHIDSVETGARAARSLLSCLQADEKPVTSILRLPMITAAENHNSLTGLPHDMYETLKVWECEPNVLSGGLYMAMPWFDCPELAWCVTRTVLGDDPGANKLDELAEQAWELRHQMEAADRVDPQQVVPLASRTVGRPIAVGDGADATNSGATGDVTTLLQEFLKQPIPDGGALTFMVDPVAVSAAQAAGEGGVFDSEIGGRLCEFSKPIRVTGTVEKLFDVRWVLSGHISSNLPIDMGAGAVIRSGDVTILLCERSGPGSSPKLYEAAGLDPRDFKIVVAKSPSGFRADYESFAVLMISADCPGCASPAWNSMPFENITRPLWPLDEIDDFRIESNLA